MINIIIGLIYSLIIAIVAYKKEKLSKSGAIAAVVLGTSIFYFGGIISSALMVAFFISSSMLSIFNKKVEKKLESLHEKGSKRDYVQVFANGGVALVCSIIYYYTNDYIYMIAMAISFAASTADTWASEIGVLSKKKTISIITFKEIENGMSGGVSLLGTFSALCGAGFIAVLFIVLSYILNGVNKNIVIILCVISVFGFLGAIIDSILGATLQGSYLNEEEGIITEKKISNGQRNKKIKGFDFINNDVVNIVSNILVVSIWLIVMT